jgi:hypothetical protein
VTGHAGKDPRPIVEHAYWLALSRAPTPAEIDLGVEFLLSEGQSTESFCHLLFTLNEVIYVD